MDGKIKVQLDATDTPNSSYARCAMQRWRWRLRDQKATRKGCQTQFSRPLLLMRFIARTIIANNKHSVDTAIILFAQCLHYLYYFLSENFINGFIILLQKYARKGIDAKNLAILRFSFFVTERTQLNEEHA